MLISLYSNPLDKGGLCHHLSVPSIAYWIRWSFVPSALFDIILGLHWSHSKPLMPYFPGTVASLQNSSSVWPCGRSYPQVALAVIVLPRAMLKVSWDSWHSLTWKFTVTAQNKSANVICVKRILGKTMNFINTKLIWCPILANTCWIWQAGLNYVSCHIKLGRHYSAMHDVHGAHRSFVTFSEISNCNVWHRIRCANKLQNPWIWRDNQRGVLIGFSYSEIRFLIIKNIVKCLRPRLHYDATASAP